MKKSRAFAVSLLFLCVAGVGAAPLMIAARTRQAPILSTLLPSTEASAVPMEVALNPINRRGSAEPVQDAGRPRYDMALKLDWKLLSFRASGDISVPVRAGESLRDAVFFVFANAGGVGGADSSHANIAIDNVALNNTPVPWKVDGAVLHVALPQAQLSTFVLHFDWHGVIPRLPPSDGISDLMGGAGADLSGLLGGALGGGGAAPATPKREENTDFGLYAFGNGVLSLGAFWYPTLAVRTPRHWIDEAPHGLGDVSYAVQSDYSVSVEAPPQVLVAAPGQEGGAGNARTWKASGVRDFPILASDSFVRTGRSFDVGGKNVDVEAFTTRAHASKSAQVIDIAGRALQIYARRFGPYAYDRFAVVEGPLRAGAGGMEYSGMTAIASALYGDLQAQLSAMTGMAGGVGGDNKLNGLLGDLEKEAYGEGGGTQAKAQTSAQAGANTGEAATAQGDNAPAGMAGMGLAGDLLKQQSAIMGSLFEETIAHETAHQWWAIGVGSDSQRAPWVDESLTNWSSMLYFEDRYNRARSAQMMEAHLKTAYAMARMLGTPDDRADKRTSDYVSNLQYGGLVYGKGALFYAHLRELMGDGAFFAALNAYFADYDGRLSNAGALIDEFKRAEPGKASDIEALYERWIQGVHGDEDITGGTPPSLADMLGQAMGGAGAATGE